MVRNYSVSFLNYISILMLLGVMNSIQSQEIKIFTKADFDLKGEVKSCLVSTKYGKESYEFNKEGFLTKSLTQFNDEDYDITYYKYTNGELVEKRFENYRNNIFDSSTSYANLYELDTIPTRKVTESIISYDNEFLDRFEYVYDEVGVLVKIIRTNNDGSDETLVEYTDIKGEQTQTYSINGTLTKSIRNSITTTKDNKTHKVVLSKRFLNGEPQSADEVVYNEDNKRLTETKYEKDIDNNQFVVKETVTYEYDEDGMLVKTSAKEKNRLVVKEFIYQFDNSEEGNWIKEIITPDNSYTSRKITYYEEEVETPVEE